MRLKWKIKDGDFSKDGTSTVIIFASKESLTSTGIGSVYKGWNLPYIKISLGEKSAIGIVESIRNGPGSINVDPALRHALNVSEGTTVDVEEFEPIEAEEVQIAFPKGNLDESELTTLCRTFLSNQPLSNEQIKPIFLYSGEPMEVEIVKVFPNNNCIFTGKTRIVPSEKKSSGRKIRFQDIGGLDREIRMLRERIIWPLQNKEFFTSMGIRVPRGILFAGPPGCGKTLLARSLSSELGISSIDVRGPELFAGVYGESEKRVRDIFSEARKNAPSLILIDEIDAIAPARQSTRGELERRLVTMLLTEMDGLQEGGDVIVVATTNEIDILDIALRRPGRFDFEVSIGAPDVSGRLQILKIHSRHMPLKDVPLEDIAKRTHGYSGADLMNLCREAAFNALKRSIKNHDSSKMDKERQRETKVEGTDFDEAVKTLRPSALREFAVEVPTNLSWEDVGGLQNVKETLVEEIVRAIGDPETFDNMGIRPVRGVLLYGPPGTGKTLLARVIANKADANFISVRGPEILSKWVGESELRVRQLFERARQVSPCIVFFDEIDALTSTRGSGSNEVGDRVVNQLLTEMDGFHVGKQVCVIAATNRKEIIDPALLRPGRFDYMFEVPLPNPEERRHIFDIHLKDKPTSEDVDTFALAEDSKTDGFSGAHIAEVCRRAGMDALRGNAYIFKGAKIRQRNLTIAIEAVRLNIENLEKKVRKIGFGAE